MERFARGHVFRCIRISGHNQLKNKRYYIERAAYMRGLAKAAMTESLRKGCLKAAEEYERLAEQTDESPDDDSDQK